MRKPNGTTHMVAVDAEPARRGRVVNKPYAAACCCLLRPVAIAVSVAVAGWGTNPMLLCAAPAGHGGSGPAGVERRVARKELRCETNGATARAGHEGSGPTGRNGGRKGGT